MDNRGGITEKIMLNHDKMCLANNGPRTVAKAIKVKAESENTMKRYAPSAPKRISTACSKDNIKLYKVELV